MAVVAVVSEEVEVGGEGIKKKRIQCWEKEQKRVTKPWLCLRLLLNLYNMARADQCIVDPVQTAI